MLLSVYVYVSVGGYARDVLSAGGTRGRHEYSGITIDALYSSIYLSTNISLYLYMHAYESILFINLF